MKSFRILYVPPTYPHGRREQENPAEVILQINLK